MRDQLLAAAIARLQRIMAVQISRRRRRDSFEAAVDTAVTLLEQAMSTSDLNLITTTVSLWQRVLTDTPADYPDRAMYLSNLGLALQVRFERVGVG